jgi:mannose-1-phosphate guanylyltransferase
VDKECFAQIADDSIDYCLMENTKKGAVVAADFTWSDVGSWDAVWAISPKDALGNARLGDTFVSGVSNSLVRASGITLAVAGVENLIVVGTKDAVLVVDKNNTQDVKKLVEQIKQSDQDHLTRHHDRQLASWGETVLLENPADGPAVHRLTLRPGGAQEPQVDSAHDMLLSVIAGTVRIEMDGARYTLGPCTSAQVPAGTRYAFSNESADIPARLLQSLTHASAGTVPAIAPMRVASDGVVPLTGNRAGKNSGKTS